MTARLQFEQACLEVQFAHLVKYNFGPNNNSRSNHCAQHAERQIHNAQAVIEVTICYAVPLQQNLIRPIHVVQCCKETYLIQPINMFNMRNLHNHLAKCTHEHRLPKHTDKSGKLLNNSNYRNILYSNIK